MDIVFSSSFKKDYKRITNQPSLIKQVDQAIELLATTESLPPKFKEYLLIGNWSGYSECHIKPDLLLIFKRDKPANMLKLARLGNHSDLFK